MQKLEFISTENNAGQRLDIFLTESLSDYSRSSIQKLIKSGNVKYDGQPCLSPKTKLDSDAKIKIVLPPTSSPSLPEPEEIPIEIIYEDETILVINKQPDIVVHPAESCKSGTVVNALLSRFADFSGSFTDKVRPGIVHRLDKETSGCLLIAKNQKILEKLIDSFKKREVEKTYIALVVGHLKNKKGIIKTQIGRHPVNRKKMAVLENGGKEAITHYEVMSEGFIEKNPVSCLKVKIETGRTHQIRVHLASIHRPVLGDKIYGGHQKIDLPRQMLHAWKLKIKHPETGKEQEFTAPIPKAMQELIRTIE